MDRSPLDEAFADAMGALAERYPDDLDAATLYAESLMNRQPWNFWQEDGHPKGRTPGITAVLESIMERDPDHAGALHLYIHAIEASDEPELGVAAADHLRTLIPGSGHLVHMPSHIYARVGRWHEAMLVNEDAVQADDAYLGVCRATPGVYPLGYVPHKHHFPWFTATMAAPTFAKVHFGLGEEIRALPEPEDDLPFLAASWHYAQAFAALRGDGDAEAAAEHHAALEALAADPRLEQAWAHADVELTASRFEPPGPPPARVMGAGPGCRTGHRSRRCHRWHR